ncbi:toll/interleukin-1 receptor domain-containing protein [Jeotgalicoccus sp. FSL K6-3177]|uniref:toll/interleukin-1 receptor domain-containing protein n=1 Tax=Jeotgalicoccus sp. FSL K6-3177 TaxID=2921494 RepID=UPI0030FDB6B4
MGKAKRTYDGETIRFNKQITNQLNKLKVVLPKNYTKQEILNKYKEFYPSEWFLLQDRQRYYIEKAKHLKKYKGYSKRYNTQKPELYFLTLQKVKNMVSKNQQEKHLKYYDTKEYHIELTTFRNKKEKANKKIREKWQNTRINTQTVDPVYLDSYIKKYHKKGSSNQEKLMIVSELMKYDDENVIRFFRKLNDAERNDMLREKAFFHLQSLGYYVKLRGKFKGKIKSYHTEKSSMSNMKPIDLFNSIKENGMHRNNSYNAFISHSSRDKELVRETIKKLNDERKTCYCDWSMDNHYLKREFVTEITSEILKIRMRQCDELIYLRTESSVKSEWVKFELDYFEHLNKNIYVINKINDNFNKYPPYFES